MSVERQKKKQTNKKIFRFSIPKFPFYSPLNVELLSLFMIIAHEHLRNTIEQYFSLL